VATDLEETAVFLVHTLKQVLFGFDQLKALGDHVVDGSPAKAFYLNSIYNYIATLFLLDKKEWPMGGTAYRALQRHGLCNLLDPVKVLLDEPIGQISFGEIIRVFRNSAFVHGRHSDADLDRVYAEVDMTESINQVRFQNLLCRFYDVIMDLAVSIINASGRPSEDFGLQRF
jgi:hypothetical protein